MHPSGSSRPRRRRRARPPYLGRHPLGATAVGRNKAQALAERLQADFPHLQIEGRACGLHHLLQSDHDVLGAADLIVAATGSRSAESALNRWHIEQGRAGPILYGWTEARACAGHAVAIVGEGREHSVVPSSPLDSVAVPGPAEAFAPPAAGGGLRAVRPGRTLGARLRFLDYQGRSRQVSSNAMGEAAHR